MINNYTFLEEDIRGWHEAARMSLRDRFLEEAKFNQMAWFHEDPDRSLESIHSLVHGSLSGFMLETATSAFDPAFFLHHVNVDRLWAIWAATKPDTWMEPAQCMVETYTTPLGQVQNDTSPLYPFRSDASGKFHTSRSMRHIKDLGYAYEDVPDWLYRSPRLLRSVVRANVARTYPEDIQRVRSAWSTGRMSRNRMVADAKGLDNGTHSAIGPGAQAIHTPNIPLRKWLLELTMKKHSSQTIAISIFFGAPSPDPREWSLDNNLILTHSFSTQRPGAQKNELKLPHVRLPFTNTLIKKAQANHLTDLGTESVANFIQKNLEYRIRLQNGTILEPGTAAQLLKINVASAEILKFGDEEQLPELGPLA